MRAQLTALALALTGIAACSAHHATPAVAEIIEAAALAGEHDYTFDPSGLSATVGSGSASYGIARKGDDLAAGSDTYHFDALGRVDAIDQVAIAYGPDGQIERAT